MSIKFKLVLWGYCMIVLLFQTGCYLLGIPFDFEYPLFAWLTNGAVLLWIGRLSLERILEGVRHESPRSQA